MEGGSVSVPLAAFSSFSSALRLGMLDVKPVIETSIKKLWGVTLKERKVTLRPLERRIESLPEFAELLGENLAERITLPERFHPEEFTRFMTKTFQSAIEEEPDLKNKLEELLGSKRRGLDRTYRFMEFMEEMHKDRLPRYLEAEAAAFLNSDFPLSVSADFVAFHRTYSHLIHHVAERTRYYTRWISLHRSLDDQRVMNKYLQGSRSELGPIVDQYDKFTFSFLALKIYINACNSESYDDLRGEKFLSLKKVDDEKFDTLHRELVTNVSESRKLLVGARSIDRSTIDELFGRNVETDDPTFNMIREVLVAEAYG